MDVQIESVWICAQAGHGSAHANTRAALRRLCTAAICADNRWLPTSAGGNTYKAGAEMWKERERRSSPDERGGGRAYGRGGAGREEMMRRHREAEGDDREDGGRWNGRAASGRFQAQGCGGAGWGGDSLICARGE